MTAALLCRKSSSDVDPGREPRVDDAVPYAAPLGLTGFEPERAYLGAVVKRAGGWSRAVMVSYAAVLIAAAVVLAVTDRLA
jgi:hypothetical protein